MNLQWAFAAVLVCRAFSQQRVSGSIEPSGPIGKKKSVVFGEPRGPSGPSGPVPIHKNVYVRKHVERPQTR